MRVTRVGLCGVVLGLGWGLGLLGLGDPLRGADQPAAKPNVPPALSVTEAMTRFDVQKDLVLTPVLTEPVVRQPVFLNFDERGRMWVVQYLQYPEVAGSKVLSRDSYWRVVWDKVPLPPPRGEKGRDKITIHVDTDGDGTFDKERVFVDGLNIATAVCKGRGGAWVLNPPYLLFYPDKNQDDVPDGDPVVHLSGFGMEDTHSVVNSLCWGPDGWLYAAQGSTVTGNVLRPGLDKKPVPSLGQLVWRYHPEAKIYEIFAEGGGNAFGIEFDDVGRVFSGHNGGDTRGFHYVQGGYFQKGFNKHGPLSNPYTFGYFPQMPHNKVQRFTHTFVVYGGDTFPPQYQNKIFGVAPLLHHVVLTEMSPHGSSLKTQDIGHAVTSTDKWFTPVDIKHGPDGALYVADWYDAQCAHLRSTIGLIDKEHGRIYRLQGRDAKPAGKAVDLGRLPTRELVEYLKHKNKWYRQTALRLLGDRKDASVIPVLREWLETHQNQLALEALWAIHLCGGLDDDLALKTLEHANPYVRAWTVRLLGDRRQVSSAVLARFVDRARVEPHVEVRSQLACTARRLPVQDCLAIVRPLLARNEDALDVHLPLLLWWDLEAQVEQHPAAVVDLFRSPATWDLPIVKQHILSRLMRRFAATGQRKDLVVCAQLLKLSPGSEHSNLLLTGFEAAYTGRPLTNLPDELTRALEGYSRISVVMGLRQGRKEAVDEAVKVLQDPKGDRTRQLQYVQVLGEVRQPAAVVSLLRLATESSDNVLQATSLAALQNYDDAEIATKVLSKLASMTDDIRSGAVSLLLSRKNWTEQFFEAVAAGRVDKGLLPAQMPASLIRYRTGRIAELSRQFWGEIAAGAPPGWEKEIARLSEMIQGGEGKPTAGRTLFTQTCAKCHTLWGKGGNVGPDLTSFKRDNLEAMLLHIVYPSAEIREGFTTYILETKSGRTASGFLVDQDPQVVVLRTTEGQDVAFPRSDIELLETSKVSLMPEGMLKSLTNEQIRDLFAYIRMTQPLIDK